MCLFFKFEKYPNRVIRAVDSFEAKKGGRTQEYAKLILPILDKKEFIMKYGDDQFVQVVGGSESYKSLKDIEFQQYTVDVRA